MVVSTVYRDVLVPIFLERRHELLEVFFASDFAHVLGREVAVHSRSIPISADRFAMELEIHAILFTEASHEITSDPYIVRRPLRALAEDLEFPLTLGDLRIDSFVIDAGVETQIEMLVHNLARDIPDGFVAHAGVVFSLRRRISLFREPQRAAILIEKIFLLET